MNKKYKLMDAVTIGAILTVLFVTALTIWSVQSGTVRAWLKMYFVHHWVGKGLLAYMVFGVTCMTGYLIPYTVTKEQLTGRIRLLMTVPILATAVLSGFYVYIFLLHSEVF